MARKPERAKWALPEVVDPEDRLCFTIQVPNERMHLAAFRGALWNLASAVNWADDPEHTAKDVANVWKQIYDEVEACLMAVTDVRQNEESPCILEKQIDGGDYVEFANLQLCPPRLRTNEGRMQFWDGTQWLDLPGEGDERYDGEAEPPWPDPPVGELGNCLAAENLTALLAQQVGEWSTALTAGAIALGIVTIITGVLSAFFIPWATVAILGFATTLVGMGATGIDETFTEAVYERFKCIIYCRASSDGSITLEQYEAIIDDIQAESGTAWDLIETWVNFFGPVGFTRAGNSAGITDGDCDCTTCRTLLQVLILDATNGSNIPSDFDTVIGTNYEIEVTGVMVFGQFMGQDVQYDGAYWRIGEGSWALTPDFDGECTGDKAGLNINGTRGVPTPSFSSEHFYKFEYAGDGDPFNFCIGDDSHINNTGSLTVKIYRVD